MGNRELKSINEVIIHCSATEAGRPYSAKDVDKWHKARGWAGIGYHYIICIDGTIQLGRPLDIVGAHCQGHNQRSIGICYIGGLKDGKPCDTRTRGQKQAIERIIIGLHIIFPNITKVTGHNEYAAKACPCFDAKKEYMKFLQ